MKAPTIRKFVTKKLKWGVVMSDEDIVNSFWRRYMWFWNYSSIAKKWEGIRKDLWRFKREWFLAEVMRHKRKWGSEEIFYKLS